MNELSNYIVNENGELVDKEIDEFFEDLKKMMDKMIDESKKGLDD